MISLNPQRTLLQSPGIYNFLHLDTFAGMFYTLRLGDQETAFLD